MGAIGICNMVEFCLHDFPDLWISWTIFWPTVMVESEFGILLGGEFSWLVRLHPLLYFGVLLA
jgi:hypothetical protein